MNALLILLILSEKEQKDRFSFVELIMIKVVNQLVAILLYVQILIALGFTWINFKHVAEHCSNFSQ